MEKKGIRAKEKGTKTLVLDDAVAAIIKENDLRNARNNAKFNPITGEGSVGERTKIGISDFPIPVQYIPVQMMKVPLVKQLVEAGSIEKFYETICPSSNLSAHDREKIVEQFVRVRIKHDFPFWAALYVYVLSKIPGGGEVLFRLNRAQRKLVAKMEGMRTANLPIRIILLKTRQWGGSTCIQLYIVWLQLVHRKGLNSIIMSQTKKTSFTIKAMYDRALEHYPVKLLHALGEAFNETETTMVNVGLSGDYKKIPQRDCTITIASYEAPDAVRGDAYALAHFSEVGLWDATEKKTPEKVVRSACQGIAYKPYTMIAYESTANGTGNFFHKEYLAAKDGKGQFQAIFIPWMDVEWDTLQFQTEDEMERFARKLYDNRNNDMAESDREEPGTYLWWLWQQGATLEGINWYVIERTKCTSHADMASECPTDDDEAFTFSGRKVFAKTDVDMFRAACRPPRWRGEIYGETDKGENAVKKLRFRSEENGRLSIWHDVEKEENEYVIDRYLVVVDVCKGLSQKADFADILVIDRLPMMSNEPPVIAAEWHGHIEMDRLAWKATQVAAYYNNALLVIESNTLETNNTKGEAEYILTLVADVYGRQLYARKQSAEDIRQKLPRKYGFHTNTATKKVIIYNLQEVIREHLYVEREEECLNEYLTYIETDKGGYEAMEGYHDDRIMTRAIGFQICFHEMDMPRIVSRASRSPKNMREKVISEATIG